MMKAKTSMIFGAALPLLLTGPAFGTEEPVYRLLEKDEEFEIRQYGPRIVAEVHVEAEFEEAGNRGFRPLADYIFGNNKTQEKMAMTAPVSQQAPVQRGRQIAMTAPVTQQSARGNVSEKQIVRFSMPKSYTMESLPVPVNPEVKIIELQETTVAVIRYSGFWSSRSYQEHLAELRGQIAERGLNEVGEPVWARYNPPYMPWFLRRNEIHIPVSS